MCIRDSGLIEVGAVASVLARVVADTSVDRRERVVHDELAPRQFLLTGLDQSEPFLDVLARGAGVVARREQIHVHRHAGTDRTHPASSLRQVGTLGDVSLVSHSAPCLLYTSPSPRR